MILNSRKHAKIVKRILLDGKDISHLCYEVDTDTQTVKTYTQWPPLVVNGELLTQTLVGKVEIEFEPTAQKLFDIGGILEE